MNKRTPLCACFSLLLLAIIVSVSEGASDPCAVIDPAKKLTYSFTPVTLPKYTMGGYVGDVELLFCHHVDGFYDKDPNFPTLTQGHNFGKLTSFTHKSSVAGAIQFQQHYNNGDTGNPIECRQNGGRSTLVNIYLDNCPNNGPAAPAVCSASFAPGAGQCALIMNVAVASPTSAASGNPPYACPNDCHSAEGLGTCNTDLGICNCNSQGEGIDCHRVGPPPPPPCSVTYTDTTGVRRDWDFSATQNIQSHVDQASNQTVSTTFCQSMAVIQGQAGNLDREIGWNWGGMTSMYVQEPFTLANVHFIQQFYGGDDGAPCQGTNRSLTLTTVCHKCPSEMVSHCTDCICSATWVSPCHMEAVAAVTCPVPEVLCAVNCVHGTCDYKDGVCQCENGWTGADCSQSDGSSSTSSASSAGLLCEKDHCNDHGSCLDPHSATFGGCKCFDGWEGEHCELVTVDTPKTLDLIFIPLLLAFPLVTIAGVGIVLAIIGIGMGAVYYFVNRRRSG